MSAELPDITITRGEKLLASVLAVFLLIGGLWAYFEPLDRERGEPGFTQVAASPAQRSAIGAADAARATLRTATDRQQRRLRTYELAREDYRTDLDAHDDATKSHARFLAARGALDRARGDVRDAQAGVTRAAPAARDARAALALAQRRADADAQHAADARRLQTVLLRLAWCLLWIVAAVAVLNQLRRRHSRYFVAGGALVAAATAQAAVMAGQYLGDNLFAARNGPLALSLAGIAASLLGLVALQRYVARRTPRRRVRKGDCPYCGFPVRGGQHCEGCGRAVLAACAACGSERRVGAPRCAACGQP